MANYSSSLQRRVADVLREPVLQHIDFSLEDFHINSTNYGLVADAIETGRIQIELSTPRPGAALGAAYTPGRDMMSISGSGTFTNARDKATIVHESTHAMLDMLRIATFSDINDEAASYLAESVYLHAQQSDYVLSEISDVTTRNLIGAAQQTAQRHGLYRRRGRSVHLTFLDCTALRAAITAHRGYSMLTDDPHAGNGLRAARPAEDVDTDIEQRRQINAAMRDFQLFFGRRGTARYHLIDNLTAPYIDWDPRNF